MHYGRTEDQWWGICQVATLVALETQREGSCHRAIAMQETASLRYRMVTVTPLLGWRGRQGWKDTPRVGVVKLGSKAATAEPNQGNDRSRKYPDGGSTKTARHVGDQFQSVTGWGCGIAIIGSYYRSA